MCTCSYARGEPREGEAALSLFTVQSEKEDRREGNPDLEAKTGLKTGKGDIMFADMRRAGG